MEASLTYARAQDASDELRDYRNQFHFPPSGEVYFLGNSLGLQPIGARAMIDRIADSWKTYRGKSGDGSVSIRINTDFSTIHLGN